MNSGTSTYALIPGFLNGPSGRLFCLHYKPRFTGNLLPAIIHVPALTEEMNKSRRMVALQARKFVAAGYPVYVFDLHGTGDSEGELEDVTWESWQKDLGFLCDYVRDQGVKEIWLWGLRGGCLLASDCLQHTNVTGGLFWQPMRNGQQVLSQLQRLQRLAPESPVSDSDNAQNSGVLEVSGYTFSQQLLEQLSRVSLIGGNSPVAKPLILINVSIMQESNNLGKLNNWHDDFLQIEGDISVSTVSGDPFWLTPEVALAPDLLAETSKLFKQALVKEKKYD